MTFAHLAQYVDLVLGTILVIKLLRLRLHKVYGVFCLFLAVDLLSSAMWALWFIPGSPFKGLDYRLVWLVGRCIAWILTLWTILNLLDAVLAGFSGIAKISRAVFRWSFLAALVIAAISAVPEYTASGINPEHANLENLVIVGLVVERVVASTSLIVMLSVLIFLLWFPKQVPRNLALFSIGFLVYFGVKNLVLLARSFWSHNIYDVVNTTASVVAGACFAYWALFLSSAGEQVQTKLSIHWKPDEQERLMHRLELLNESLLRTAKR